MLSNLIALVAIYQWFGKTFQEHVDERENEYVDEVENEYAKEIYIGDYELDTLQQELDLDRKAKYDYFTKELGKSDLPLSEKRYYKGAQDMINKMKETRQ